MSLQSCIKRDKMRVFARLFMKRRETSGNYETNWQTIPSKYIKKFGTIDFTTDDVTPFFVDTGGFNFTTNNSTGYFSGVDSDVSFFYGKLSRFRTLVKVDAGYIDTDDTEYPTASTIFVGVLGEDAPYQETNEVNFQVKSLCSILQEVPADEVAGLGTTQTAYDIITKIRDHQDSNLVYIFRKYITSTSWHIYTTTSNYNIATSTSLQGVNCWELIKKLAGAEDCITYISRAGEFYFRKNTDVTSTAVYHFSGLDDPDKSYGHNIMKKVQVDDGLRKIYNRIRIKHGSDDTTTSYYIKKETWAWGDSSSSFRFGVREYKYENDWLTTATATDIATTIYTAYSEPKQEVKIRSKFVPQLDLLDTVSLFYRTKFFVGGSLWGKFNWGSGRWGLPYGYNLNLDGNYKIIRISHSIDNFSSDLTLRAL